MSVLFNHAGRYELFDRNPIYLVRQSAKGRRTPAVLMPTEINALADNLDIRERTLVLLAVSTGLRQSELFGLKWGDIDFGQRTMNVTRSIVYGFVGPCKRRSFRCTHPSWNRKTGRPSLLMRWGQMSAEASTADSRFAQQLMEWLDKTTPEQKTKNDHKNGRRLILQYATTGAAGTDTVSDRPDGAS